MDAHREQWIDTLFSTAAADRPAAEAGVRAYFDAARLTPPATVIWVDSPAEACDTALLLGAAHDPLLARIAAAFEAMPKNRERLACLRDRVREATGAADWRAAVESVGPPLTGVGAPARQDAAGTLTLARIELWEDATAAMGAFPNDELFQLETRFWGVVTRALQTAGTMLQGSLSRRYHLAWMARDEAKVAGGSAPPMLAAAWQVARSAGPWWPFRQAVMLADRPLEAHRNGQHLLERGDGPALVYRDGWRVCAWNGDFLPEKWIAAPESIPASEFKHADKRFQAYVSTRLGAQPAPARKPSSKPSAIWKAALPADAAARLDVLRRHAGGRLPRHDRYQQGERQEVWKELVALGADVRLDPHAADALAVAYETMGRVAANVVTLVERLRGMGYRFQTEQSAWDERAAQIDEALKMPVPERALKSRSPHVVAARKMMDAVRQTLSGHLEAAQQQPRDSRVRAHVPPDRDAAMRVRRIEKRVGTLPLSLRAFYEVVGSVDLLGSHASLTPRGGSISPDPLVVWALDDAVAMADEGEEGEASRLVLAPDDLHKANVSGGEAYAIEVPDDRADGEFLNERHGLFFVDYLRLAFRFGGFPGYEGYDRDVPPEVATLGAGLLEV